MRPAFAHLAFPPALDTDPRPDWPLAAAAQRVILGHVRRLLSLREAAWNADVESVRRLRVAARRARTALSDFQSLFDADLVRDARRALSDLADGLGRTRDLDVLLGLAAELAGERPDNPELAAACRALQRRRDRMQSSLHDALRDFELAGWPSRLVTYFAAAPLDLWRFVDLHHLLQSRESTPDS
ncbi:MAG: CHAD domain-containing protein [Planctomycetota bacterium]